jgi:hypothetical protein
MFWFVSAVVLTMMAIIDLATNVHVLLLRRLSRNRERRASSEPLLRHPAIEIDPTLDLDTDTLLRALHGVAAA